MYANCPRIVTLQTGICLFIYLGVYFLYSHVLVCVQAVARWASNIASPVNLSTTKRYSEKKCGSQLRQYWWSLQALSLMMTCSGLKSLSKNVEWMSWRFTALHDLKPLTYSVWGQNIQWRCLVRERDDHKKLSCMNHYHKSWGLYQQCNALFLIEEEALGKNWGHLQFVGVETCWWWWFQEWCMTDIYKL